MTVEDAFELSPVDFSPRMEEVRTSRAIAVPCCGLAGSGSCRLSKLLQLCNFCDIEVVDEVVDVPVGLDWTDSGRGVLVTMLDSSSMDLLASDLTLYPT